MTIDEIYINEAKRIRKTYLTNIANIVKKEEDIQKYFNMIEDIKKEIDDTDQNSVDEKFYINRVYDISDNIDKVKNHLMPYYENIKKLDNDQKVLYNNIRDKYPDITDDEIQNQIVPHVVEIDKEFTKKNEELYNKILEKKK